MNKSLIEHHIFQITVLLIGVIDMSGSVTEAHMVITYIKPFHCLTVDQYGYQKHFIVPLNCLKIETYII